MIKFNRYESEDQRTLKLQKLAAAVAEGVGATATSGVVAFTIDDGDGDSDAAFVLDDGDEG